MRCPKCNIVLDLRTIECDEDLRRIFELLPAFGAHSRLAAEYVELFGVTPISIKTKKYARLLAEVAGLFVQKKFTWRKATYEISENGIVEGLRVTCNADLVTPIKDHNYLRAVLAGIADRERAEGRASADAQQRRREDRGQKTEDREQGSEDGPLSAQEIKRRAAELVEQIGSKA